MNEVFIESFKYLIGALGFLVYKVLCQLNIGYTICFICVDIGFNKWIYQSFGILFIKSSLFHIYNVSNKSCH